MLVPEHPVYLMPGFVDMRKAINGLSLLVDFEGMNAYGGSYFIFCGKTRQLIKILYWEINGFCLWQKRLEKQRFKWPKDASEVKKISSRELRWLLDGLNPFRVAGHRELTYSVLN